MLLQTHMKLFLRSKTYNAAVVPERPSGSWASRESFQHFTPSLLAKSLFRFVFVKTFYHIKDFRSVPSLLRILCFVLFEFNAFFVVVAAFYYHMNFLLHYINILNYMLFKILNLT